ncbi:Probable lipoprotein precursor [Tenacibaculum maritimum]|nr:Probable lipoprotein precursor [Tenacibaculum maritimum]
MNDTLHQIMKKLITLLCLATSFSICGQKDLSKLLKKLNNESIPYISVDSLHTISNNVILLDAREPKEFDTSHLPNAIPVGYNLFNIQQTIQQLPADKNAKIVVYCSLGIRSEDIAEQLKAKGYTNIFNLYGGIFEWKNKGKTIVNSKNTPTNNVHTFNKKWSKWLLKGNKIYE